jgi:FAD-dependent urate hydroxylase
MPTSEVLIIGAGPYGLSISAHLRGLGIDHLIVGRPMDTWRNHVPAGMHLNSEPYGSDMSSPQKGYDLASYCRAERIDGIGRGFPLSMERFLDYSDWYIKHLVPDVSDITVTEIKAANGGFRVAFADAGPVAARNVVIATGLLPYCYIPAELSGLPSDLVSHATDHHRFDRFRGRRVAVVGAGSSALGTAALLHEAGGEVRLVMRCMFGPVWSSRPQPLTPLTRLRHNRLCDGWRCHVWNSPTAFRLLPESVRLEKARTVPHPSGGWSVKDRVVGVVGILGKTSVRRAEASGSGVRLLLDGPTQSSLEVDHVIAGTGFRIDIARLGFLPEELRARIATINGFPVLTRAGESTVPGLYFAGAPAAFSLGPSMRFLPGTYNLSPPLARSVTSRANRWPIGRKRGGAPQLLSGSSDQVPQSRNDALPPAWHEPAVYVGESPGGDGHQLTPA